MKSNTKSLHFFLFLISPFLGFFSSIIDMISKKSNYGFNFLLIITCSLLGLINSKKIIESDLILYSNQFELSQEYSFFEYLVINFKDPLYYSTNYLFYHFISNDFSFFIFFLTFVSYYFLLKATYIFSNGIGLKNNFAIFAVILCALFPQLFSFSGHLLRQFLSISIGYYFISLFLFVKSSKYYAVILILSSLIHSSNLIFVPFLFFKSNIKSLFKYSIFISPLVFLIYSLLNSNSPLINGFRRLQNITKGAELEPLSQSLIMLIIVMFFLNFINNYKIERSINKIIFDRIFFFLIFLFFIFINNTEISSRLLPNIYFFWPIILSFFFKKIKFNSYGLLLSVIFILGIFIYNLNFGVWTYENLSSVMLTALAFF